MTSLAHPNYPSPRHSAGTPRPAYPGRKPRAPRTRRLAPLAVDMQDTPQTDEMERIELDIDAERVDAEREVAFQAFAAGGAMTTLLYAEAARTPLLSAEQERTLLARAQAGDRAAVEHLVRANVRLVGSVCRWYLMRTPGASERLGVGRDDLMQEGLLGLLKAIEKFDLGLGHRFSTYAVQWIRQAMSRARDDRGLTIRLPVYLQTRVRRVTRLRDQLVAQEGEPPSAARLAQLLDLTERQVTEAVDLARTTRDPLSLDRPIEARSGDDALSLADQQADPQAQAALDAVEEEFDRALAAGAEGSVTQIIAGLKRRGHTRWRAKSGALYTRDVAREMEIVERRVLLGQTLDAIALEIGLTRERVRQLQEAGFTLIREERRRIRKREYKRVARERTRLNKQETGGAA